MRDTQILRTQYRVSDFVAWQRDGALELNPNFQRRPVWKKGAKSYLIDTILRGLPMPIIFLRDIQTDLVTFRGRRDVVDGQQRIRTILSFVDPKLVPHFDQTIDDFAISSTHNKELGGKRFNQLPHEYQQRILDYQFSVHSFPSDTDDREILQIFARMNSTGVKANDQELRNAEFYGRFKTLAYKIATEQLNRWRDWKIFTPDQIARMSEVELTSEFMMLMVGGVLEKTQKSIDVFYQQYDETFPHAKEVARRFRNVFDTIETSIPTEVLREIFSSRSIFFALYASVYALQFGLREASMKFPHPKLDRDKPLTINRSVFSNITQAARIIKAGTIDARLQKALRGATTHASERQLVIRHLLGKDHDPWPPQLR